MTVKTQIAISPPNIQVAAFNIKGTAPLMQARFSKKGEIMLKMAEGGAAKNKKTRTARDYEQEMESAIHYSEDGWPGIPAAAFRSACISACRLVGFKMTIAKMSVFIDADGLDREEGTPLVKLSADKPELSSMHTRNATGVVDVRARPLWRKWGAELRIKYDADQFSIADVANLVQRAGMQVGIGEGRPDSRASAGLGFGTFEIARGQS